MCRGGISLISLMLVTLCVPVTLLYRRFLYAAYFEAAYFGALCVFFSLSNPQLTLRWIAYCVLRIAY